jgi:hypothetical protein
MIRRVMLDQYRAMSPRQRLAEMRSLMEVAARALRLLPPEERARRLATEDRLRRDSINALLRGLAAQESRDSGHDG